MKREGTDLTTARPSGRLWGMGALIFGVAVLAGGLAVWYLWIGAPAPPG